MKNLRMRHIFFAKNSLERYSISSSNGNSLLMFYSKYSRYIGTSCSYFLTSNICVVRVLPSYFSFHGILQKKQSHVSLPLDYSSLCDCCRLLLALFTIILMYFFLLKQYTAITQIILSIIINNIISQHHV